MKFEQNSNGQCNFGIWPDFKCLQVRGVEKCEIEAEFPPECNCRILSFYRYAVGKNVKFEQKSNGQCNFGILPDFKCLQVWGVEKCEIQAEFPPEVQLPDFEFLQVRGGQKCEI